MVREDWFKTFLELPNGIPWHDTINRVFAGMDPHKFEQCCFRNWVDAVLALDKGQLISIDGKTIRGYGGPYYDSKASMLLMRVLKNFLCSIKVIIADGGYRGEMAGQVKKAFCYVLKVVMRPEENKVGFKPVGKDGSGRNFLMV